MRNWGKIIWTNLFGDDDIGRDIQNKIITKMNKYKLMKRFELSFRSKLRKKKKETKSV